MSELSPRQRMINMMYLVLTALLALNVSKEVLDSFFSVNKSLGGGPDFLKPKMLIFSDFFKVNAVILGLSQVEKNGI